MHKAPSLPLKQAGHTCPTLQADMEQSCPGCSGAPGTGSWTECVHGHLTLVACNLHLPHRHQQTAQQGACLPLSRSRTKPRPGRHTACLQGLPSGSRDPLCPGSLPPAPALPPGRPPPPTSAGNPLLGLPLPQGWPRMAAPPKGTSVSDEGSLVRPSPTWLAASYLLSSSPPFLNLHSLQHPRPPPSRSEFSFHNAWHPLL